MLLVCRTALYDRTKRESEHSRYVDTTELPFLTIDTRKAFRSTRVRLGDLATVVHPRTGRYCHGIVGDSREVRGLETSLFLSQTLDLRAGEPAIFLIHPESGLGQGTIPSLDQIGRRGERLLHQPAAPDGPSWGLVLADYFADVLQADIRPADCPGATGSHSASA